VVSREGPENVPSEAEAAEGSNIAPHIATHAPGFIARSVLCPHLGRIRPAPD
jgi:hypothetical protein